MARKERKRKFEDGKETAFYMNERLVPPEKINRTLKRMKVQEDALVSHGSPTACEIPCVFDLKGTYLIRFLQLLPLSSTTIRLESKLLLL
jgi:hypothetical protein